MSTNFGENHLDVVDYVVVSASLLISLSIGVFYALRARKHEKVDNDELFTGSRKMSGLPVAASMAVSSFPAIALLGLPAEIYVFGCQLYMMVLIIPLTTPISMYLFIEVLYNLKLTSAYQISGHKYLEYRFNSVAVRYMASAVYIIQNLISTGITAFAPTLALETITGLPVWLSLTGMIICCIIYTSIGGLKAVVWSDVFQLALLIIGVAAIIIKGISDAGGFARVFEVAGDGGRLDLIDWTVDPLMRHNTVNLLLGQVTAAFFVTINQGVVQRYCSVPTYKDAIISTAWSSVFSVLSMTLIVFVGIVLFSVYANCDPLLSGQITNLDQILPFFVIDKLAYIPGMLGLFIAAMFSAELSSISSILNSLAAVTWEDFLMKSPLFRGMNGFAQATAYRVLIIIYGAIIGALALNAKNMGTIFQASVTVVTSMASIQGSVFFVGVFIKFVNKIGVIAGMLAGVVVVGTFSVKSFILQRKYVFQTILELSTEGCPNDLWNSYRSKAISPKSEMMPVSELDWPDRLFTLSYVLYPFIGTIVTITVAVIVSLLTGGRKNAEFVKPEYLHELVRPRPKK